MMYHSAAQHMQRKVPFTCLKISELTRHLGLVCVAVIDRRARDDDAIPPIQRKHAISVWIVMFVITGIRTCGCCCERYKTSTKQVPAITYSIVQKS